MATSALPNPGGGGDAGILSSGGSGGGDAELSSLLSDAFDSASGDEGGDPSGSQPESQIGDPQTETETSQTESEAAPVNPADPAQPGATDAASPYPLSPDGKSYMVPKQALPAFQTAQKFHQEVGKYFSTPQDAQTAYQQAADLRIMSNDWLSGDPGTLQHVLSHWAGADHSNQPAVQQRYQQSFVRMAQMIPDMLQKISPQAHSAFIGQPARFDGAGNQISPAQGMLVNAVNAAYEHASKTGNAEDFKRAQELDYGVTGNYKTELPQYNPQAQQLTEQQRQMQDFNQRQTAALTRDTGSFNQAHVEGDKFKQLGDMIDSTLKSVKGTYPEKTYNAVKSAIHKDIVDQLQGRPEWWLEHKQNFDGIIRDFKTLWNQGQNPAQVLAPRIQAYKNNFVSEARRILPSVAKEHIGSATRTVVNRNQTGQFAANQLPTRPNASPQQQTPAHGTPRISRDQWDAELAAALKVA